MIGLILEADLISSFYICVPYLLTYAVLSTKLDAKISVELWAHMQRPALIAEALVKPFVDRTFKL
jgi:hypothetical protein